MTIWEQLLFIIKSILLGVIEGLTEFLPVSSTGHLIIFQRLFGLENNEFNSMFLVVIQLGAILAVLLLFWPRIWVLIKGLINRDPRQLRFWGVWILGCVPAVVLGLFYSIFDLDNYLFTIPVVTAALFAGALLMLFMEQRHQARLDRGEAMTHDIYDISWRQALTVGLAQCLALWPGFSRSASTIMGGWLAGFSTPLAADYSFFLSIPIMFGASGVELFSFSFKGVEFYQIIALIVGFLTAFVVALIVVKAFLKFLHTHQLKVFAWYRIAVAALMLVLGLVGVL